MTKLAAVLLLLCVALSAQTAQIHLITDQDDPSRLKGVYTDYSIAERQLVGHLAEMERGNRNTDRLRTLEVQYLAAKRSWADHCVEFLQRHGFEGHEHIEFNAAFTAFVVRSSQ